MVGLNGLKRLGMFLSQNLGLSFLRVPFLVSISRETTRKYNIDIDFGAFPF